MQRIVYADLSEKVYKELRTMLLEGELLPGEKLKQDSLATRLGISRTPLAAAFSKLEKEMLIELLPRRGARVRALNGKELLDLYDIRIMLEPLGAEGVARNGSPEDIAELLALLANYKSLVDSDSPRLVRRSDYDFHLAIARMSGNESLYRIISAFNIVFICNQGGLLKPARTSYEEHAALMDAISAHDQTASAAIMRAHLVDSRQRLLKNIQETS
ncbi:MAG: GntR family transcriptional regulator [Spirochaetales bacterium]